MLPSFWEIFYVILERFKAHTMLSLNNSSRDK